MTLIQEFNEFTWDMVRAIPKSNYLKENSKPFTVECKPGLAPLYLDYTPNVVEIDKFNEINDTQTYNNTRPDFTLQNWLPPNLKERYSNSEIAFDKPAVVIQNKYTVEWSSGIYNYFSLEVLDILFGILKSKYTIVYIRPDGNSKGYYTDANPIREFKDYEFIKDIHPEIVLFKDLLNNNPHLDYNTLQFMVEASSERHITTSGGNACVASYFGGDVVIYDSPQGAGAGRGIWKTDSWLSLLSGANIYGVNNYVDLIDKVNELWIS